MENESVMPPESAQPPAQKDNQGMAIASFVLGILSIFAWCLPFLGFPIQIIGLILGILGIKSSKRGLAIAGIVLCSLGLLASCGNAAVGAYLGVTSQF